MARGLLTLELVANSTGGLSILELSQQLGVHRSIATRLLATLADFHLIRRGADGRYRPAAGLAALARHVYTDIRDVAKPVMEDLADRVGSSVALFVEENRDAVAVVVTEPAGAAVRVSYREGARHPLDRGAAGYALQAALPESPGEDPRVSEARRTRYVMSFGEVVDGYWGLGVPLPSAGGGPAACLTLISASKDLIATDSTKAATIAAAAEIRRALA